MRVTRKRFFLFLILIVLIAATIAAMGIVETNNLVDWMRQSELTIHWTTASDEDIVGFNLYRADSPGGEFVRVNDSLIRHNSSETGNSEYRFVDKTVIRGRTYYYQLAIVYHSGQEIRKGPYAITAD